MQASLSLPFGSKRPGFYTLDGEMRAVTFCQANADAQSFDGGLTRVDVGYHGTGAPYISCLVSGDELCGCSWPLDSTKSLAACVNISSDSSVDVMSAAGVSTPMPAAVLVALGVIVLQRG